MSSDLDITFNPPNGFTTTSFNTLPADPLPQDIGVAVVIRSDNRIVISKIMSVYNTIEPEEFMKCIDIIQ